MERSSLESTNMRLSLTLLAAAFPLSMMILPGCASEDTGPAPKDVDPFSVQKAPTFVKESVNVDQKFADSTVVSDDHLVVILAGNEAILDKVEVGSIIAGNRSSNPDLNTSKNPYGFLRRVTGKKVEGGSVTLTTERAELADWIEEGDLIYSDPRSVFGDDSILIKESSLGIRADSDSSGSATAPLNSTIEGNETTSADGKLKAKPFVKLANASVSMNAKFDGYFKVRKTVVVPTAVQFKSLLTMNPTVSADIEAGVKVVGGDSGSSIPLWEGSWDGPSVKIPIGGPIPLTLRFEPRLKCSLSATGSVSATVHATIGAHAAVGFEGGAGTSGFDWKDLSEAPDLGTPTFKLVGVQGKAGMSAECALLAVPVLLAFDAVGIQGEIGPYVSLDANACVTLNTTNGATVTTDFSLYEQHGLAGEFGGRVQIPFLNKGKDFELASVHFLKSEPRYLVGDDKACKIPVEDSCEGKDDGFYCSSLAAYSGFLCERGQIARGFQCGSAAQKCTGGSSAGIRCK